MLLYTRTTTHGGCAHARPHMRMRVGKGMTPTVMVVVVVIVASVPGLLHSIMQSVEVVVLATHNTHSTHKARTRTQTHKNATHEANSTRAATVPGATLYTNKVSPGGTGPQGSRVKAGQACKHEGAPRTSSENPTNSIVLVSRRACSTPPTAALWSAYRM
jgi:hypothetical protein